jgi:DNA-directed RNA polymerase
VAEDAANGDERALVVRDQIDRKVVKQTVMTSVYGVTMVGARDQVLARLKERGLTGDHVYKAAMYLSRKILDGIGEVCTGASRTMDWLASLAEVTTRQGKAPVVWDTPLGLRCVQPYFSWATFRVNAVGFSFTAVHNGRAPVKPGKQVQSFPPNYIHSIDASHMMFTALECRKQGLDFAAVHDSYWSHAEKMDQLNMILRDQFVDLHQQPLLENLLQGCREAHPGLTFPDPPQTGMFDISLARQSAYFFS